MSKRGFITGQVSNEEKKLKSFDRVRAIQDEMVKLAKESGWVLIEQKVEMDPLDLIASKLEEQQDCRMPDPPANGLNDSNQKKEEDVKPTNGQAKAAATAN